MKMFRRILLVAVSVLIMGCGPGKIPSEANLTIDKSSITAVIDEGVCSGLKEIGEFTITNNNPGSSTYTIYKSDNFTTESDSIIVPANDIRKVKVFFNCKDPLPATKQIIKVEISTVVNSNLRFTSTDIAVSVTAGPSAVAISLDKTRIDALFVDAACPQTMGTFTITNNNKGSVKYTLAPSTNFTVSTSSFTLAQGATKTITVQYDCVVEPPLKQSIGITATAPSGSTTLKGTATASVEVDLKSDLL